MVMRQERYPCSRDGMLRWMSEATRTEMRRSFNVAPVIEKLGNKVEWLGYLSDSVKMLVSLEPERGRLKMWISC